MSSTQQLRMVPVAAAATLAVALCLHPLIEGGAWYVAVVLVVGAVAASGVAARQVTRLPAVVLLVQGAALTLALLLLFVREYAVFGVLPGAEAIRALADLVGQGRQITAQQAPPVDAAQGVLLLIAAGLGLVALVVDAVAVTWRRPAVAGLALLSVYCVPAAILRDGTSWVWFVLAASAYLALLAAEGGERVRAWGRVLSSERSGPTRVNLASAAGGRQAAAVSLALAVFVPAVLPTFTTGLTGFGTFGNGPGDGTQVNVLNPILDVRRNLSERSDEVVLTYSTTMVAPEPLRVVADEQFNGVTWSPSSEGIPTANRVQDGLTAPPGLSAQVATSAQQTTVRIGPRLNQTYLPLPYPATRVDVDGSWIYNSSTLDVLGRNERTAGLDYEVQHLQLRPTREQLAAAGTPPTALAEGTQLPRLPDLIRSEARRVAGTGSAYDQAVRLQQWFRSGGGFAYSVEAPGTGADDGGLAVMEAFLTQKRGYCVHFASTMAVMARSLGIPARVAVGFLPGTSLGQGRWQVTFRDAHAWPELYFEGVGWVRFEPTPAVQSGTAPSWTLAGPSGQATAQPSATTSSAAPSSTRTAASDPQSQGSSGQESLLSRIGSQVPWRVVLLVAALALAGLVPRLLAAGRRALRWRQVRTRSDRAEAAWDDLRSRCADLGVTWPSSHTPRAIRDELVAAHELAAPARDAMGRLLVDLETARYAPPAVRGGRSREELRDDVRAVTAGVAAAVTPAARRRATWWPVTAWEGVESLDADEDARQRVG